MGRQQENEQEFSPQSYWRLLKYAKPYWFRMSFGILCGFLVGGSLFISLMLIPQLMNVVDPGQDARKNQAQQYTIVASEIVSALAKTDEATERQQKVELVESIIHPKDNDPQLTKTLNQLRSYSKQFNLPLAVGTNDIKLTWPVELTMPVKDDAGRIAWQIFAIYIIGFVLAWTVKNLATYANKYYTRWVGAKVVTDMRNEIFERLLAQSLRFYGKMDIGHLISRCTNDIAAIESSISNNIADATRCPIEILACIAALVVTCRQYDNYTILMVLLCGMPLVVLPMVILSRKIRKLYKSSFAKIADVVSRMHEVFTGIMVVKAYNTERKEIDAFRATNRRYFRIIIRALKLQLLMSPLMESIAVASTLVFLLYSYQENVSLTQLTALLAPAFMAYEPIKNLSKVLPNLQRSMAAADRYFAIIDTDTSLPEKSNAVDLKSFERKISFKNVDFAYEDHKILDDVTFDIPKGSLVAVVGETGSGKTTIANLIARFYDVDKGCVAIDGVDVRNYTIASLRKHIGIVSQDAILFNDTIANNIAYGCSDATEDEIIKAAKQANAHGFIVDGRHEQGYSTEVGEKGFKLSGGEKQRVAIARAILKNPPILILDEATSALDTVTERLVQDALNRVMSNRTVFAIAHRLSTIQDADMIIVLEKGKIIECGTHDELLSLNGKYKNLHDTQFGHRG